MSRHWRRVSKVTQKLATGLLEIKSEGTFPYETYLSSRPIQNLSDSTIGISEHLPGYRKYTRSPPDLHGLSSSPCRNAAAVPLTILLVKTFVQRARDGNTLQSHSGHLLKLAWSRGRMFQRGEKAVGPVLDVVVRKHPKQRLVPLAPLGEWHR